MAYTDLPDDIDIEQRNPQGSPLVEERDMTLVAAVAIQDPPKDGVR
jgi:magnesium-transporting ATPase (P-type)